MKMLITCPACSEKKLCELTYLVKSKWDEYPYMFENTGHICIIEKAPKRIYLAILLQRYAFKKDGVMKSMLKFTSTYTENTPEIFAEKYSDETKIIRNTEAVKREFAKQFREAKLSESVINLQ